VIARERLPWKRSDSTIEVELWQRGHRQKVHLERRGDHYRLWSIVARAAHVTQSDRAWRDLAYRAWRKNSLKELVGFSFDRQDRLIGVIEQPAATFEARFTAPRMVEDYLNLYLRLFEPIGNIPPVEFEALYFERQETPAMVAGLT
jgi:hypothetical protein